MLPPSPCRTWHWRFGPWSHLLLTTCVCQAQCMSRVSYITGSCHVRVSHARAKACTWFTSIHIDSVIDIDSHHGLPTITTLLHCIGYPPSLHWSPLQKSPIKETIFCKRAKETYNLKEPGNWSDCMLDDTQSSRHAC